MLVAVTGAAGFVGVNLVNHLLGQGHDVVAVENGAWESRPAPGVRNDG